MSSATASDHPKRPLFLQPWPGYWTTKGRLERLARFKNLIIHRERWGPEIQSAPTLSDLFPGENLQEGTYDAIQRIEREIREHMMLAAHDLWQCGVATRAKITHYDRIEQRRDTTDYDLVLDYFNMADNDDLNRRRTFEALMERVDMGIGIYKARLPRAKRELYNPVAWLAYIVRLPVTILERAGLASHPDSQQMIFSGYGKIVKTLVVFILVFIAVRLGVTIPWKDIGQAVLDLLK